MTENGPMRPDEKKLDPAWLKIFGSLALYTALAGWYWGGAITELRALQRDVSGLRQCVDTRFARDDDFHRQMHGRMSVVEEALRRQK